jgi:hypothetical protein
MTDQGDVSYKKTLKQLRRIGLQLIVGGLMMIAAKPILVYWASGSLPALDSDFSLISTVLIVVGVTIYPFPFER